MFFISGIGDIFKLFINILYPNKCISCKKIILDGYFCSECWKKIKFISEPYCMVCGIPLKHNNQNGLVCASCSCKKHYYNRALSVFVYDKIIAKTIFDFKMYKKTFLSKIFAKFLLSKFKEINKTNIENNIDTKINNNSIDYIIPVPMYIKKLQQRGFNQSLLVVKDFSNLVNIPYIQDLLIKSRNTAQQSSLNFRKRRANLRFAFKFNENYRDLIKGKNLLIIDDVLTTGTTVDECARILKKNGVSKVFVITLARGGMKHS